MSQIMAVEVRYLGLSDGLDDYYKPPKAMVVLAFRLDPEKSFKPRNLMLTAEQAIRLRDDINSLFATSEILKDAINETPE